MTIDVVPKLEFLVELFEQRAARVADGDATQRESETNFGFAPPRAASRSQTLTLAELLAGAPALLDAFGRSLQDKDDDLAIVVRRIARFLVENTETIGEDTPQPPRLLHYVYPVV
jgi:hypothetical protein